jgi:uncharacterized membrane protein YgcG
MGYTNLFRCGKTLSASLLAGGLVLLLAPSVSHADQFVLFDVMYTYTQSDAVNAKPNKSHFYVRSQMNPLRPKDWTAPVDYRNGTVHVRTEVIDMPAGGVAQAWTLCYIPYKGIAGGYGCTNTSTYSQKGLYDRDVSMTSWWQNEDIVWSSGIMGMDLVLKDDKGVFSHLRPDPEHFFPTTMRITMVQVSAGAKYDPSKVPNIPAGPVITDGGAADAPAGNDSGPVVADAGPASGSGGADGSGGASGTGGTVEGTGGASGTGGTPAAAGSGGAGPAPGASGNQATAGCSVAASGDRLTLGLPLVLAVAFMALGVRRRRSSRRSA